MRNHLEPLGPSLINQDLLQKIRQDLDQLQTTIEKYDPLIQIGENRIQLGVV